MTNTRSEKLSDFPQSHGQSGGIAGFYFKSHVFPMFHAASWGLEVSPFADTEKHVGVLISLLPEGRLFAWLDSRKEDKFSHGLVKLRLLEGSTCPPPTPAQALTSLPPEALPCSHLMSMGPLCPLWGPRHGCGSIRVGYARPMASWSRAWRQLASSWSGSAKALFGG